MRKLYLAVVLVFLSSVNNAKADNASAQEVVCPQKETIMIDQLEQELNVCAVVDYGEDEVRTSEMLKAYNKSIDCMQKLAHKIFDTYYAHNNKSTKEHLDTYINVATDISSDITQRSDWGKNIRTAEVYILEAAGRTHFMVKNLIKEYINEIRDECAEAYDFKREFAHEETN